MANLAQLVVIVICGLASAWHSASTRYVIAMQMLPE
jgi:hypothetical protein